MPTILHLIDTGGFYGAERVLLELLMEHQHSSHPGILGCLVEPKDPPPELAKRAQQLNLPVHMFPARRGFDLNIIRDIRTFVEEHGIGLVHCHGYKPNIICGLMFKRSFRCISTSHGWARGSGLKVWFYNLLDCFALRGMDCVVGVSDAQVSHLQRAGIEKAKICRILNAIRMTDPVSIRPTYDLRAKYKISSDALVIGAVGRLAPVKGYPSLLDAFQSVVQIHSNCRLVIAGEGLMRPELEAQVNRLQLNHFVQLAGFIEEMDEFFQLVDIFVMPSLSEGMPIALLEAMAHGKPCIASSVGGIPEVLNADDVGCLVPPADSASLSKAIIALVTDAERRISIGDKARVLVRQRFSSKRMATDYLNLYTRYLGSSFSNNVSEIRDPISG